MQKWEYTSVNSNRPLYHGYHGESLDRLGDEGWELVSHVVVPGRISGGSVLREDIHQSDPEHIYTFKRPKKQEA